MSEASWGRFDAQMREICNLDRVVSLLGWDEETQLPGSAHAARGRQLATVEAIRHQRLVAPDLGESLAALESDRDLPAARRAAVRSMRRRRRLAERVPESLVKALAEARSPALSAWQAARKNRDFATFRPHLERLLELVRERGQALAADGASAYDALIDELEPEMTQAKLRPIFARLRERLVPLVREIIALDRPAPKIFQQRFEIEKQRELGVAILKELGFDFDRGRQDRSAHPFCESLGLDDVRITTRFNEHDLLDSLSSSIHEAGHAMYEQGFDRADDGTELAKAPGMGIHESQSRLWENQIGRSRAFWAHVLPIAARVFPEQLGTATVDDAHWAMNVVRPSLIRVDADEVTYNLHIILRFELEEALIGGRLSVAELPAAWNERIRSLLGVAPAHDGEGCLQDIHWAGAAFGYFPSYTIGNIYAAQLLAAYERAHPRLWSDVESGRFAPLLGWLRENVHRRGQHESADSIIAQATGSGLDPQPFLDYLSRKFLKGS